MKPGIQYTDIDGWIWGFDADLEEFEQTLCLVLGKKTWNQQRRSMRSPKELPMRLVQFKDCRWTLLYFVDGVSKQALRYIDRIKDTEISYSVDAASINLQLSDTSGAHALCEYWIGQRVCCLTPDTRFYSGTPWERVCQKASLGEIDQRLKELEFTYSAMQDGGRQQDGAILAFEDAEPNHELVRAHRLLV